MKDRIKNYITVSIMAIATVHIVKIVSKQIVKFINKKLIPSNLDERLEEIAEVMNE